MRTSILFFVVLSSLPALARAQDAVPPLPVLHVPRNETSDGRLALRFAVRTPDVVGAIAVHYRSHDGAESGVVVAHRADGDAWVAEVPAEAIRPPSVDYYVTSRVRGGQERALFASAAFPHGVVVVDTPEQWHEQDQLRLNGAHRSRVSLLGEWIDYGDWVRPCPVTGMCSAGSTQTYVDRYFHSEASYAYGMFGIVEWLRFSIGVLRGNYGLDGVPNDVGLYTGSAEITWYAATWFRVKTQLVLGISQTGFAGGFHGALVFGRDGDTQLTVSAGGVGPNVGATGAVRLSWNSIPHVPMAAVVEVSSMPGGDRAGVRLLVEAGYRIAPGTEVKVWGGYQARTQVVGGPALGAEVVVAL